jgi:cytoskeletal protein RodZ
MAPVLKTGWAQALQGSNPCTSATYLNLFVTMPRTKKSSGDSSKSTSKSTSKTSATQPDKRNMYVIVVSILIIFFVLALIAFSIWERDDEGEDTQMSESSSQMSESSLPESIDSSTPEGPELPDGTPPTPGILPTRGANGTPEN